MKTHALIAALFALPAQADVYKCVDAGGHVTYTNAREAARGCKVLSQDRRVSTVPGRSASSSAASPTPSPTGFPKVGNDTQRARDDERRRILDQELSAEQANLEKARQELVEQEGIRLGDERNYQRVLDRLQPFKDKVALHERNIESLKKEIGNLR